MDVVHFCAAKFWPYGEVASKKCRRTWSAHTFVFQVSSSIMYISRLKLANVRCFRDVEVDLTLNGSPRRWATVVGENGTGKTTLLRSLAIGLCDEAGAYSLLNDLWGDFVGDAADTAKIEVTARHRGKDYRLSTTIGTSASGNYKIEQPGDELKCFPFNSCFVCGYGAGRGTTGTYEYDKYSAVDAVYTLFNYEQALQNPELAIRRWAGFDKKRATNVCRWLESVLLLHEGDVELLDNGIFVEGRHLLTIGDGYQATIAWILDLLIWAKLARKEKSENRFEAIVLVDELEQHLHPTWQRRIIHRLRNQFPNIQFVTTSHSALCAAGVADVGAEKGYLGRLQTNDDGDSECDEISTMEGWRYDKVLTSEAFGVSGTRNISVEHLRRELHTLYMDDNRTPRTAATR